VFIGTHQGVLGNKTAVEVEQPTTTVESVIDLMSDDENIIIKDSDYCIVYQGTVGSTNEELWSYDVDFIGASDDTLATTTIVTK
jgi:hypothetical protein